MQTPAKPQKMMRAVRSSAALDSPYLSAAISDKKKSKKGEKSPKSTNVAKKMRKWVKRTATKVW